MISRIRTSACLPILLAIGLTNPVSGSAAAPCAGVVLTPLASNALPTTPEALREVQGILLERVVAVHKNEKIDGSLSILLDRDRFVLDAPGMTCAEATRVAKARIARATTVEMVIVGSATRFSEIDFEPHIGITNGEIRFRLRPQASRMFQALTRDNVGGTVVVRINDSAPIELPVRSEQTSGVIVLDRSKVPEDAFVAETLLPFRLIVSGCGDCLGEYQ